MSIGIAIVIAAILFLIDRNHVWPQVWKITKRAVLVIVGLGAVGFGGFYLYSMWSDAREERMLEAKRKADEAIAAKAAADRWADLMPLQKDLCGDRFIAVFSGQSGTFPDGGEVACVTSNGGNSTYSEAQYVSMNGCNLLKNKLPMFTCHLSPEDAWSPVIPHKASKPSERRLRCTSGTDLTATMLGSLKTGEVQVGDIVTLLENNGTGDIKVRTASGKVGWTGDFHFEVVN